MKAIRFFVLLLVVFATITLMVPGIAKASVFPVCWQLTPETMGSPAIKVNAFASNFGGDVYQIHGKGFSTNTANPPEEITYLLNGSGTVSGARADVDLSGTGYGPVCNCMLSTFIHIYMQGDTKVYVQYIVEGGKTYELKGKAAYIACQ